MKILCARSNAFALSLALALFACFRAAAADTAAPAVTWSGTATNKAGETIATVTVDTSKTPDLEAWGKHAGALCVEWYPKMIDLLPSEGFDFPKNIRLVFSEMDGVAGTSGDKIEISAKYVRKATNDFGMVIHELAHVVQSYRQRGTPGWLVEGIADYVRLTHFEPDARRPRINPDRASYRDAYKTTAIFLEWVENNGNKDLVKKLNAAARAGQFKMDLFKDYTGKTVDELWADFAKSLRT